MMKTLLHSTHAFDTTFKKWLFCCGLILLCGLSVQGQVSNYSVTRTTNSSTTEPGDLPTTSNFVVGTGTATNVNQVYVLNFNTIAPGFVFEFNGVTYDRAYVSSNGFIYFDSDSSPSHTSTAVTSMVKPFDDAPAGIEGIIAAIGVDFGFNQNIQGVFYNTTGSGSNRQINIQWKGTRYNATASVAGTFNVHLNLYEKTHSTEPSSIRIIYGTVGSATATFPVQIGIRGASEAPADVIAIYKRNVNWSEANFATDEAAGYNNVQNTVGFSQLNPIGIGNPREFWFRPPSCSAPGGLNVSNITSNAADFTFAPVSGAVNYTYELLDASNTLVTTGTATGTTVNFTSLAGGSYTIRIRTNCASGPSGWSTITFATLCPPHVGDYYQYFDPYYPDPFTVPAIPPCNSVVNNGGATNWVTSDMTVGSMAAGFTDTHLVYTDPPGTTPANAYYFTEGLTLEAGKTYRLSYLYGGTFDNPTNYNEMRVLIKNMPTVAAATTVLKDYNYAAGTSIRNSPNRETLNFTVPATGAYYIGFHAYSPDNKGSIYLDEIEVVEETCFAPNFGTATTTTNSGTVLLTANPLTMLPSGGYEYILATSSTMPAYYAIPTGSVPAGTPQLTFPGLAANTTYYLFIRSNCGYQYSLWNMVSFTTLPIPAPTTIAMTDQTRTVAVCSASPSNTILFTDSGGASGNYGNYEHTSSYTPRTYTFTAAAGFQVRAIFTAFSTESNYDALEIFDGTTANPANKISSGLPAGYNEATAPAGSFYGNTSPGTVVSTTGALTFVWRSDVSVTYAGWQANLSCVNLPSVTSFTPTSNNCDPEAEITVNGTNFPTTGLVVKVGGTIVPPANIISNTSTRVVFILPAGAQSGPIQVGNGTDFGSSSTNFTYVKPAPETQGAQVCQGSTVPTYLTSLTACNGFLPTVGNTLSGEITSSSPWGNRMYSSTNSTVCDPTTNNRQYDAIEFQVTTPGQYVFWLTGANTTQDFMAYIVRAPYTPGTCSSNFLVSDDDSGGSLRPRVTVNLTPGVTYLLITTTFGTTAPSTYTYTVTPPTGGSAMPYMSGDVVWYTSATGGTPIHTGSTFNPVGIDPALPDTNTAGTYTYYAACNTNPNCRRATEFVVTAGGTIDIDQVSGAICPNAPYEVTYTGTAANVVWTSTVPGVLFTDPEGTLPYDGESHAETIYVKTGANVTITAAGGGAMAACTNTDTVSFTTSTKTWNGSTWVGGTPTINDGVVFNGNYNLNVDVTGCSCVVNSGANVTVQSGRTMTLQNGLTVNAGGSVTFENNASLLQINDQAVNTGGIVYKRSTTAMKQYDYTYWSSPVSPQTLVGISPATMPDKYYEYSNAMDQYVNVSANSLMEPGKGYLVRAPEPGVAVAPYVAWAVNTPYTAQFSGVSNNGVPNNGTFNNVEIRKNGANLMNLIGNPYPSAIDADKFMGPTTPNAGIVGGTMYFWTHNTPIAGGQYIASDYAVYNLNGGIGTAPGGGTGNTNVPNGYVAAGQGFFIEALSTSPNGVRYATFNNSMRVGGNNNMFFRSSNSIERSRIWLDLTNEAGAFKQTLIGYLEGATTGWDIYFDSRIVEAGNEVSLYSIAGEDRLAIQGRPAPLDVNDVVPLGYRVDSAGDYQITLSNYDGDFANQDVFLEDKYLNTVHSLKSGPYHFNSTVGTFEDRFEVIYDFEPLSVGDPQFNPYTVLVYKSDDKVMVKTGEIPMETVRIYDVRGRLLFEQNNIHQVEHIISDRNFANQMLLVQVVATNGVTVTKKLLF